MKNFKEFYFAKWRMSSLGLKPFVFSLWSFHDIWYCLSWESLQLAHAQVGVLVLINLTPLFIMGSEMWCKYTKQSTCFYLGFAKLFILKLETWHKEMEWSTWLCIGSKFVMHVSILWVSICYTQRISPFTYWNLF
jgi:hypothetical protein